MGIAIAFILGVGLGLFVGLTLHKDEVHEMMLAHQKTCVGYEHRILALKSKLNELKETEGKSNEGNDVHRDGRNSAADWY